MCHDFCTRVGNQPQSTGGHRCCTEAPPVDHRWTTGGGTHSPTGGPPEIPPVVTDCSPDGARMMQVRQKSAEVQQNYRAKIKKGANFTETMGFKSTLEYN